MNSWELMNLERDVFEKVWKEKVASAQQNKFKKPEQLHIALGGVPICPPIHDFSLSSAEKSLNEMWENPVMQKIAKSIKKPNYVGSKLI